MDRLAAREWWDAFYAHHAPPVDDPATRAVGAGDGGAVATQAGAVAVAGDGDVDSGACGGDSDAHSSSSSDTDSDGGFAEPQRDPFVHEWYMGGEDAMAVLAPGILAVLGAHRRRHAVTPQMADTDAARQSTSGHPAGAADATATAPPPLRVLHIGCGMSALDRLLVARWPGSQLDILSCDYSSAAIDVQRRAMAAALAALGDSEGAARASASAATTPTSAPPLTTTAPSHGMYEVETLQIDADAPPAHAAAPPRASASDLRSIAYAELDATLLGDAVPSGSVDLVIDKGTLDSLMSSDDKEAHAKAMLSELSRVLKAPSPSKPVDAAVAAVSPPPLGASAGADDPPAKPSSDGGTALVMSFFSPEERLPHMQRPEYGWRANVQTLQRAPLEMPHQDQMWLYTLTRSRSGGGDDAAASASAGAGDSGAAAVSKVGDGDSGGGGAGIVGTAGGGGSP